MSFREAAEVVEAYDLGIHAAVESLSFPCIRVDQAHFRGRITDQIMRLIEGAYFVVADLSDERPNCYYECGYAQALHKTIIPVIRKGHPIHFDLYDAPFIVYKTPEELAQRLRERIIGAVLTSEGQRPDDPHRGKFGRCAVDLERGRILTASISPAGEDAKHECNVCLEVRTLPGRAPLTGTVTFHLHSDYRPDSYDVQAKNGVASLEVEADGVYTVGASTDRKKTLLELDLALVPGGTPDFYSS